jgi:small conductance mechanosensitive channel
MQDIDSVAQQTFDMVINLVSAWGLKVLGALVLLFVGRIAAGWVRRIVRRGLTAANVDATLVPFISGVTYYIILISVFMAVLGLIGIQTASLLAVMGAAGLAVGLALQGTLSNVASGVMLLVFRPFQVGDYIEAGGTAGSVEAIGLFTTTLNTPDNVRILVPNSSVYGQTIKNYAANDTRRNDMVMGISYDDNIGLAVDTIRRVLSADDRVLAEPEPVVAVAELADSSVNIVVRPWCKKEDYWGLRFDMMRTLKEELEAAGCSIPYPQRDVHLFEVAKQATA